MSKSISFARGRRTVASLAFVALAAGVLAACAPAPPPPPPAVTISCTVSGTLSDAVEACHQKYKGFTLDTSSTKAQDLANSLIGMTPGQCSSILESFHSGLGGRPTLGSQYPSASSASENLYCWYSSTGNCPNATMGASNAMNGWIKSPGHKANLDSILSVSVNAAAVCNPVSRGGTGVYVAVAQFHNP